MFRTAVLCSALSLLSVVSPAYGADAAEPPANPEATASLDEQRRSAVQEYAAGDFPQPDRVRELAKVVLAKPLGEQSEDELRTVATEANKVANLIGFIQEPYGAYYRENFRYEFVQKKVAVANDEYVKVANEFKGYRNEAYFNLGQRANDGGNKAAAFFFFRDAFRLSSFDCEPGKPAQQCMRWRAEQELQKLLGLSGIKSYVTWK